MKKSMMLFVVTVLMVAATANAAVQPSEREFSIFGDFTHSPTKTTGSSDAAGIGMGVSQYVTNEVSVGLQGWHNWGNDGDILVLGGNAKYHFCQMEEVSPYLGGQINYAYLTSTAWDGHADGILWGPLVGVALKCANNTSLFVEYQWQLYCGEARDVTSESSSIVVGMSWGF